MSSIYKKILYDLPTFSDANYVLEVEYTWGNIVARGTEVKHRSEFEDDERHLLAEYWERRARIMFDSGYTRR